MNTIEQKVPSSQQVNLDPYPYLKQVQTIQKPEPISDSLESVEQTPPAREGFTKIKEYVINFLIRVWVWVKYHLLFLIFDETEDRKNQFRKELGNFEKVFIQNILESNGKKTVIEAFQKLDPYLQNCIKDKMKEILKNHRLQNLEDLEKKVEDILTKDPFHKINPLSKKAASTKKRIPKKTLLEAASKVNLEISQ